jgi:DNA-binding FadR family transcriptional regulator
MNAQEPLPSRVLQLLDDVFFRPVAWRSAFDETVERLYQVIKLGPLGPGMQLPSERELVSRLGVSRTTLREAIRALQQAGLLETKRGRAGGTFVAAPPGGILSKGEAQKLARKMGLELTGALDLRSAVEPKTSELAATRATEEDVELLLAILEASKEAPAEEIRQTDSALHIAIARIANSPHLLHAELMVQAKLHDLLAFMAIVPTARLEARVSSRRHQELVEAIRQRNPQAAYEASRAHVAATEELFQDVLGISTTRTTGAVKSADVAVEGASR